MVCRGTLFLFVLIISEHSYSQTYKGKVVLNETNSGIAYVNIGIIGGNIGTVTDESGNFSICLDNKYDKDSIRFSMIGYDSESFLISSFKQDTISVVYLSPKSYTLPEIKVVYRRPRKIRLGYPIESNSLRSGFSSNDLGSELGVKLSVKGFVKLRDINFNVAVCTFDSVTYRLNIYESVNDTEYRNILSKPIYITFSKNKIDKVINFDLTNYSIIVSGDIMVALELYRDLGEGRLLFHTEFFTGSTFHRKTIEGDWNEASGVIGLYLHGEMVR
jgi:hypothetical protein